MTATLAAYLHTIDPYLVELWEGGPIRWYGLSYLLGFFLAYLLVRRVVRVGSSTLPLGQAGDLIIFAAIGVVVGGRLGYVVFYQPDLLITFDSSMPFWGLLALNQGGMASHGGMLGGAFAIWLYKHRDAKRDPAIHHRWMHLFDLLAFATPLGLFFGRIANFVNGEFLGRAADPSLPWAVRFPQEIYDWPVDKIDQLFAALPPIQTIGPGMQQWSLDVVVRLVQENHPQVIAIVEPMLTPRHPSQLYAAAMEGLVVFVVALIVWSQPRKPGLLAFSVVTTYAVMRIINELWRMPDAHLGFQALGLTRGQWISTIMLALGIVGFVIASKQRTGAMSGWRVATRRDN